MNSQWEQDQPRAHGRMVEQIISRFEDDLDYTAHYYDTWYYDTWF
jgi:hypothetical protein